MLPNESSLVILLLLLHSSNLDTSFLDTVLYFIYFIIIIATRWNFGFLDEMSEYLYCFQVVVPAKEGRFVHEQMKVVFGADLTVTVVNRAFEASSSFAAHL